MGKMPGLVARQRAVRALVCAVFAAVAAGFAGLAAAGARDDTLYWSTGRELATVSPPYFDFSPEADIHARLVWDTLFFREPNGTTYKPLLATKYKWIGATTLEIELQQGVTFHDGAPFSADDVVETVNRLMQNGDGAAPRRAVDWILNIEKIDQYNIRINLRQPMPHALEYLSGPLVIVPKDAWRSAPRGRDGQPDYSQLRPIGTGPYRVARIEPGQTVELERYRRYFDSPKGKPAIGRIVFTTIPDASERLRQVLDGRQNWIWQLSKSAAEDLVQSAAPVRVLAAPSMRVAFLLIDRAVRHDPASPLRDIRVRLAIAHAINRAEIAKTVFGAPAGLVRTLCYPTQFGCTQEVEAYEYDPEKAAALLKAAGYGKAANGSIPGTLGTLGDAPGPGAGLQGQPAGMPQGPSLATLSLGLLSYRDKPVSEAIRGYLTAAGIDVRMADYDDFSDALMPLQKGAAGIAHLTWGSYGMNDTAAILNPLFRGGPLDYCRDSEIQGWLDVANNTVDPEERKRAFGHALRRVRDLVCAVPLFNHVTYYAYSRELDFKSAVDDVPRFYSARWKQ